MTKQFLAALFLCGSAVAASAQSYVCDIKTNGDGFVPPLVGFQLDTQSGTAMVFDRNIAFVHEKPIPARVRKTNAGAWEMSWNLTIPASPRDAQVRYRMSFDPATKGVIVRGKIRHASNDVNGRGTCQPRKFN